MEKSHRRVRFGTFEVDLAAGELRKRGIKLKLQGKPFEVLALLMERPGELITRAELSRRLWPEGTYVDYDRSLNTAVNKLREVLGDTAVNPRFIETLPRRGYRFLVAVDREEAAGPPPPLGASLDSLAVLPLEDAGAGTEYLADGITEGLIEGLSRVPGLRVIARSTAFHYRQAANPREVGRDLNVQAVVVGRVRCQNEQVQLDVELVEAAHGWRLWGAQYTAPMAEAPAIERRISDDLARVLRPRAALPARQPTESCDAYREYLMGRYLCNKMTPEPLRKGIVHFERAIAADAGYALAYAGLADASLLLAFCGLEEPRQVFPRAMELALKAVELAPDLAESHASLAGVRQLYSWDWRGAEAEYLRALEMNPNYASARHLYADCLSALNRPEEALEQIRLAHELDPLSPVIGMEVAWNLYMAREYGRAAEQSCKTLELEPGFAAAHHTLALALEQMGEPDQAVGAFERACEISGGNPVALAGLGHACASAGDRNRALDVLDSLECMAGERYLPQYAAALVHAGLGNAAMALDRLEAAACQRDVWLVWLNVEPRFDCLRAEGRFRALLRRIGFPRETGAVSAAAG